MMPGSLLRPGEANLGLLSRSVMCRDPSCGDGMIVLREVWNLRHPGTPFCVMMRPVLDGKAVVDYPRVKTEGRYARLIWLTAGEFRQGFGVEA